MSKYVTKSSDYALELKNISKSFDNNFDVIKDISLKVRKGEFICFIGPSGCGKTVLLYIIAGFLYPSKGKILINNSEINSIGLDRIMVFQDHMLFPWKTVLGNILFGLTSTNLSNDKKIAIAEKYLDLVDLSKFKDWPIHKLSGGMKQRVAFARALVADPKILLMDEPFSSLDSIARKNLRKSLIKIWQKTQKTILFVTHSVNEAAYLADTIYVMSSRPTTIKKSYSIKLPHPRDMSDPEFIKIVKKLENNIEMEFSINKNNLNSDISNINDILLNNF
ncbi:MAG: ABC transporter ATP-binding protein [Nanoarchaeota archaeon]